MDAITMNHIKVKHNGVRISLVQHWHDNRAVVQECAADIGSWENITPYNATLDSLIAALTELRDTLDKESNNG